MVYVVFMTDDYRTDDHIVDIFHNEEDARQNVLVLNENNKTSGYKYVVQEWEVQ